MKDFSVWPGVLIVCFVAITILTIFPSKHKQCIDRNSTIIEKLQENDADRETIKGMKLALAVELIQILT